MLELYASEEQVRTSKAYCEKKKAFKYNFANKDINHELRILFGFQAQMVVGDFLGCPRDLREGPDDGFDIKVGKLCLDVKCELRTVDFRTGAFVHNLSARQFGNDADGFIFVSYNRESGAFQVCGYILKKEFLKKATYHAEGEERVRTDGSVMKTQGSSGMFELLNKHLKSVLKLKGKDL